MGNVGSSLILLAIAILILWLAVTDRLSRVLDAWDYIKGDKDQLPSANTSNTAVSTVLPSVTLSLPSLPPLGNNAQVGIS